MKLLIKKINNSKQELHTLKHNNTNQIKADNRGEVYTETREW